MWKAQWDNYKQTPPTPRTSGINLCTRRGASRTPCRWSLISEGKSSSRKSCHITHPPTTTIVRPRVAQPPATGYNPDPTTSLQASTLTIQYFLNTRIHHCTPQNGCFPRSNSQFCEDTMTLSLTFLHGAYSVSDYKKYQYICFHSNKMNLCKNKNYTLNLSLCTHVFDVLPRNY